jgi:RND family efflux transporter MFP subunit
MSRPSALAILAALLVACGGGGPGANSRTPASGLPDSSAREAAGIVSSVRLESGSEALLFGSGRITGVLVEEGDSVASGRILVTLSGDATAEGAVAAGLQGAEAARLASANADRQLLRISDLFEAGAISESDLEGARTAAAAADAGYLAAQAGYTGSLSGRNASIVQAPFPGVVGRVWAREGSMAGQEPLLMLTGGDGFIARALLPERFLGTIETGTPARFETEALPGTGFEGQVVSVSPSIDPVTCLLPVTVSISDSGGRLASGLYGTIFISR